MERLTSVPIGMPISNCNVVLVGEGDERNEGEIHVGGLCLSTGYLYKSTIGSSDYVRLHKKSTYNHLANNSGGQIYFKTGDFGRMLPSGDLLFLGRKDRTIKLNGQRIALEEIENTLRTNSNVADAAVVACKIQRGPTFLEAFILSKERVESSEIFVSSVRSWMNRRLPLAMIPNLFTILESLPMSSSGKVDYKLLADLTYSKIHVQDVSGGSETGDILQVIKKVCPTFVQSLCHVCVYFFSLKSLGFFTLRVVQVVAMKWSLMQQPGLACVIFYLFIFIITY